MGSPISPIVANLYMEDFEIKAIKTAKHPPRIWKRYVDDTFVVIESAKKEKFLEHINKMDPHIQFTTEDAKADGSIPFLETIVMPQSDNSLLTSGYIKPTHRDLYLQWDSHHHMSAKFSVINTLKDRAKTLSQQPATQGGRRSPQTSTKKMQVSSMGFEQGKHKTKENQQD